MIKVAKPELHGLSVKRGKFFIVTALINSVIGGAAFQIFYINRKRRIYREFYEQYDIDKEFEEMMAKGLFDSC